MRHSLIDTGGLFRCCVQTVREDQHGDAPGRLLECPHCGETMIFENGAWRWCRAEDKLKEV